MEIREVIDEKKETRVGLGLILIGKMLVIPDRIDPHRKNACYTRKVAWWPKVHWLHQIHKSVTVDVSSAWHECTEVLTTLELRYDGGLEYKCCTKSTNLSPLLARMHYVVTTLGFVV